MSSINQVIPLCQPEPTNKQTIKWTIGNAKYEIHITPLRDLSLDTLLPHCVDLMNKIRFVVGVAAHLGPSYYRVMPRAQSSVLTSIWDQIVPADRQETPDNFAEDIRSFIAAHSTVEDRHELLQQLRSPRKPRELTVQSFYCRLLEINELVNWLPGDEPALTADQLKQAFYDAMPPTWRDRFIQAGHSSATKTQAELLHYFRQQEKNAKRKEEENERANRRERHRNKASVKMVNKKREEGAKHKRKMSNKDKETDNKRSRLEDNAPCPIHPNANHTWGECFANAYNKNRPDPKNKEDRPAGIASKPKKKASTFVAEESNKTAINDESSSIELEFDDMETGKTLCYMSSVDTSSCTHHLDLCCFTATSCSTQANDCNHNEIVESYMTQCDQEYSNGVDSAKHGLYLGHDVLPGLHLRPVSTMLIRSIQSHECKVPLRVLFDTGSDRTMINQSSLPKGAVPKRMTDQSITGLHGTQVLSHEVMLENISFPEFTTSQRVTGPIRAIVYNNPDSRYDVILGMDVLHVLGIDISCTTRTVHWNENVIPFQSTIHFEKQSSFVASLVAEQEDDPLEDYAHNAGYKSKIILESKYDQIETDAVASEQSHLSKRQQQQLADVLRPFTRLFSGKLGRFPTYKVKLEPIEGTKPTHCRPYPVPKSQEIVFKHELARLCEIGVLSRCGASQWLSPTFIIPKKDGRVRWISDFRALNRVLKRKVYNLPKIQEILTRCSGYSFFSKLDISMQYYTFELTEDSKELCTICTPFGNYRYNRLPMGIHQSPDIAQQVMEDLFRCLDEVDVYIDDIGIFSPDWDAHLRSLTKVLTILEQHNFTVNPRKCEWGVSETDWLGYWLTPTGLKPWRKKIDAILAIDRPTTVKQLRSFLGAVNYYRDMFPRRSHILAPLTELCGGKGKLKWTPQCEQAFQSMKALLAQDAFLRYPDHNQPFEVYADASDYQLGAVIMQAGKPVAYYSRKLNQAQRNYTVGEKELLSIVETLKTFRTMLYGCQHITVYTDHKNNTFQTMNTQRVLRWRLFLEDFGIKLLYIKGETNNIADALSRLPFKRQPPDAAQSTPVIPGNHACDVIPDSTTPNSIAAFHATNQDPHFYTMAIDDPALLECFVNLPASENIEFKLDFGSIADAQTRDARLEQLRNDHHERFARQLLAPNTQVFCHIPTPGAPWKIYLPTELLDTAVRWYHLALGHLGQSRLVDTMSQHFYHPDLRLKVESIVTKCDTCQRHKQVGRGHGHTAAREAEVHPWREIAMDLIGPWKIRIGQQQHTFHALTIIDTVTNLAELVRLNGKSSAHVSFMFETTWLARYPLPRTCIYDQGGEFIGQPFQQCLQRNGVHGHPTSTKNPQANAICERMHQTVGNSLRVLTTLNPPQGYEEAGHLVDLALANAMFATRAAMHGSLKASPGSLAFSRDMVLDIPFIADWQLIKDKRQQLIDDRLIAAN